MRLRFSISKFANHFFFVSNLAEWHFSCRKEYNRVWLRTTGKLTPAERAAIEDAHRIMNRYGFTYRRGVSRYLGRFFLTLPERAAWRQLQRQVTKTEFEHFKQAFKVLMPRFDAIWRRAKRGRRRLAVLRKALRSKPARSLLADVERLFGTPRPERIMTVVVILSPLGAHATVAGGANIGLDHVTFEVPAPRQNTWQLAYSIALLGHEIGHVLWDETRGPGRIARICRTMHLPQTFMGLTIGTTSLINEIIIGSFVQLGALGQKYFTRQLAPLARGNETKERAAVRAFTSGKRLSAPYHLINHIRRKLWPLAHEYARGGRPVDDEFIRAAATLVRDLRQL